MNNNPFVTLMYLPMLLVMFLFIAAIWLNSLVKFPAALFYSKGRKLLANGEAFSIWYKDNVKMTRELIDWVFE